jgi:hypothetical protein
MLPVKYQTGLIQHHNIIACYALVVMKTSLECLALVLESSLQKLSSKPFSERGIFAGDGLPAFGPG